ncbi:TPA: hypothetical protein UN285_000633 [Stenotrophomonas maltophilia]|nr:hypothetical protein [Stenotrophomonas maltophilia]HEL3014844.1 hypothetical protein [Stenotrophomonas maltophilia]HEL4809510.1 hypothetical protein [Stenotrophomonas maltophilia]HEL5391672.1 hypothetical protein [Stenotrophomonas maltophilia]
MPLQLRNGEVWHWQGDEHDFPESLVCPVIMSAETLRALLAARRPVGEPVAIPEGWALVDLAEYTVLPQIPTTAMMDAGWPIGEQITDRFDVKGAYADLIAEHDAKGQGIIHGPSQQPAQAVDLPYSLDADQAGIRARVCDVITGTLMVAAQGHTPPPAGHWAQPFWQAARHDAARALNVTLKLRQLVAASKYMRDRVVETRGAKCMDDLDYAIDEAEKALTESQAVQP